MRPRAKITIDQLARKLELAKSTVSRALNGYPDISEETRERVQKAALESGYVASSMARNLKRGRVDTVGIVLAGEALDISNPFIVQFLSGTTHILQNRGIDLLVANASEPQLWQETYDRLIVSRKVDGFIVMRTESDDPRISYLLEKNVPFVAFGRTESAQNFAWLDIDCGGAAADAVRHLAALGHQRIGHITASRKVNFARLRHHAIKQAITELGWQYDPSLVVNAGLTAEDGQRASCQLMALEHPPTALICDLDLLAFGAIAALRDLGLQAGRHVSVIGYGDVPFAGLHSPALSTYSQDAEMAGRWIAEMLLALVNGTAPEILQRLRPATFVQRASDGPPALGSKALRQLLDQSPSTCTAES